MTHAVPIALVSMGRPTIERPTCPGPHYPSPQGFAPKSAPTLADNPRASTARAWPARHETEGPDVTKGLRLADVARWPITASTRPPDNCGPTTPIRVRWPSGSQDGQQRISGGAGQRGTRRGLTCFPAILSVTCPASRPHNGTLIDSPSTGRPRLLSALGGRLNSYKSASYDGDRLRIR